MRGGQFKTVKTPKVRRNKMDMRNEKRLTADLFWLYPIMLEQCIPGDFWKIGNEMVIRMNPLVAPLMHEINAYVHYFFVPYRLLWDDWEKWITGGEDGKFTADIPLASVVQGNVVWEPGPATNFWEPTTLYDYLFGMTYDSANPQTRIKDAIAFPIWAYNLIWNEYYRDQNIIPEVDKKAYSQGGFPEIPMYAGLRKRAWEKDYFTSLLPWQQRGDAPALPISGLASLQFPNLLTGATSDLGTAGTIWQWKGSGQNGGAVSAIDTSGLNAYNEALNLRAYLNSGKADLSAASTFDVSDLRLAFQIQKFLERNARSGSRYVEFLRAHFPAWPRDDRLNRPEYIGGSKTPIVISEVLQTSSSDSTTPQGNMAGHGISADRTYCGSYRVQEHGLIMGLLSFLPKAMYQQGIDRQWLVRTKYDFYFPEFAALSEQAVYREELYNYVPGTADTHVLGYQGRYDEYRFRRSMIHGQFRDVLDYWHMGRKFASPPELNRDLIYPNNAEIYALKRVLAVPSEPMFLVAFGNNNTAIRPMPWMAEPGLIDHF